MNDLRIRETQHQRYALEVKVDRPDFQQSVSVAHLIPFLEGMSGALLSAASQGQSGIRCALAATAAQQ
jgi:hypothetical protein